MQCFFLSFNERLVELFPEIFESSGDTTRGEQSFAKKWGNYAQLYQISQGDIRRFETITKYKLFKCLTFLAYEKEKSDLEHQQFKAKMK